MDIIPALTTACLDIRMNRECFGMLVSCQHTVLNRSATELNQGLPVCYSVLLLSFTSDETRQHRGLGSLTNDINGRQLKGYKDLST